MKTVAALLILAVTVPARAQTSAPVPAVPAGPNTYGAGHKLCSDWVAAETKPDQSDYYANRFWVAGFMSAYNIYVSPPGFDVGKGTTPTEMKTFMHTRCATRPTDTIAMAATAFIANLKARQGR
ncbi:hypothetical protein [Sphingomonas bacterium]|uniref:hypothetical protein n=1 Tax=Sphingomonas bacterium TaxID=1895847 RepID=UPI001576C314|nr:hypothetical protein [Sphingomonas bacterium]